MNKIITAVLCVILLVSSLFLGVSAASAEMHWYCTRQKAHRQAIAAPELRFVEECGAYYIDHIHNEGNEERVVYLTFDAGYENGNVERVMDTLRAENVPAAFFVLKHFVTENANLMQRMEKEGHLVCNHTARHKNLSNADADTIKAELAELEQACAEIGVRTAPYFRPPEGSFSESMLKTVQGLGYKTVFWSFAYADWDNGKQPSRDHAKRCIFDNIHNGAVLLLHPTSATNAAILEDVIIEL